MANSKTLWTSSLLANQYFSEKEELVAYLKKHFDEKKLVGSTVYYGGNNAQRFAYVDGVLKLVR